MDTARMSHRWWRNAQEVNASSGSSAGSSNASSFNSSIAPTPTPGSQGLQGVGASPVGPAPLPHNDTVARVLHHNDAHGRRSSGKQSRMSKMDMSKPRKVLEQELLRTMHAPIHSLYGDHPSVAVEWSGIVGTPSPPPPDSAAGDGLREWSERLLRKRDACLRTQKTGVFWHYHSRKCGGTSLRHLLEQSAKFYKAPYWESEGRSVMGELLEMPGVLSAISLRHPIERIVSLYWYEHVGWWHSIKKDKSQLRNFTDWSLLFANCALGKLIARYEEVTVPHILRSKRRSLPVVHTLSSKSVHEHFFFIAKLAKLGVGREMEE